MRLMPLSSYGYFPQDWPDRGIHRKSGTKQKKIWTAKKILIGWPANQSRFVIKWLKRGRVNNLDLLKKELWKENIANKSKNTWKIELQQAPTSAENTRPIAASDSIVAQITVEDGA
jgi:hypothetical protein